MPMTYRIAGRTVRFTKLGDVNHNEVLSVLKRAFKEARDTRPDPARWDMIVDLRKSSEVRSDMEMRGFVMALTQQRPVLSGRVAVVVTEPQVAKQIRKFVLMAEQTGHKPRVFRTLRDAQAWLKASRPGRPTSR